MKMVLGIATREWEGWQRCVDSWQHQSILDRLPYCVALNKDVIPAYQYIYENTDEDIIALLHDDLMIYEPGWDARVLREFRDPAVGVVGFGGAIGHGQPYLYEVPYHLPNLARQHFLSNMRSAEKHGGRFTGERDVAIIDGFSCIVRRSILDKWGGFPIGKPVGYFMWCENLCCEARRQGFRIRLVGIDCEHLGGRTSTVHQISDNYEAEHRYFFETNRDVMPYAVKGQP